MKQKVQVGRQCALRALKLSHAVTSVCALCSSRPPARPLDQASESSNKMQHEKTADDVTLCSLLKSQRRSGVRRPLILSYKTCSIYLRASNRMHRICFSFSFMEKLMALIGWKIWLAQASHPPHNLLIKHKKSI